MTTNKWVSAQEALDIINDDNFSWINNFDLKYIDIRVDTRDGKAVIKDRHGKQIDLNELKTGLSNDN